MEMQEILLVEDSVDYAFLVRRVIDKYLPGQFRVSHRTTMADAEAYIRDQENDISIILLDLGLPDTKSGRDTFEHMKKYAPHIPIVVLTSLEDQDLAVALVHEGVEDFVNKRLLHEKPERLRDILKFAACRHQLMRDTVRKHRKDLKDKEEVISWMSGDYSVRE